MADYRFSSESILGEVQNCLETMLSHGGYSANRLVFGSDPACLSSWQDGGKGLQFAQQWKLRLMARKAVPSEIANGKLRSLLAHN